MLSVAGIKFWRVKNVWNNVNTVNIKKKILKHDTILKTGSFYVNVWPCVTVCLYDSLRISDLLHGVWSEAASCPTSWFLQKTTDQSVHLQGHFFQMYIKMAELLLKWLMTQAKPTIGRTAAWGETVPTNHTSRQVPHDVTMHKSFWSAAGCTDDTKPTPRFNPASAFSINVQIRLRQANA